MNCEKISKPDLRDEPFFIRREISLKRRHYGREHTADALACRKTVDYSIVRHFLILPSSF
jgi:hypothetical protein